ncbi:MAG: YraN family protein [Bacteroidales bacterium]
MTAQHLETGKMGEALAAKHLQSKGYKILEQNWRYEKDEIDIIATDKNILVIVEVKTRSTNYFGEPEESVSRKKQQNLIRATNAYVEQVNWNGEVRYDIISVVTQPELKIHHIRDAFYPLVQD